MVVTVIAGPLRGRGWQPKSFKRKDENPPGPFVSREIFGLSLATDFQPISLDANITILGVGTATGFAINRYSLATDANETRSKFIYVTGTGEAYLHISGGTATGLYVFDGPDDFVATQFLDGKWRVLSNTATVASST